MYGDTDRTELPASFVPTPGGGEVKADKRRVAVCNL